MGPKWQKSALLRDQKCNLLKEKSTTTLSFSWICSSVSTSENSFPLFARKLASSSLTRQSISSDLLSLRINSSFWFFKLLFSSCYIKKYIIFNNILSNQYEKKKIDLDYYYILPLFSYDDEFFVEYFAGLIISWLQLQAQGLSSCD